MIDNEDKILEVAKSFNIKELSLVVQRIIDIYKNIDTRNYNVYQKADGTFVTDIDYLIEESLLNCIKENFPTDNLVTEEFNSNNEISKRTWIIDPIDGTMHFLKKDFFWGTQLAFQDEESMLFSVVYMPRINEFYFAVRNKGTYLNGERVFKVQTYDAEKAMVEFVGSYFKESIDKLSLLFQFMKTEDAPKVRNILYINACCAGFTNLIAGRTDAIVLSAKKPWDIIPGKFLCHEVGIEAQVVKGSQGLFLFANDQQIASLFARAKPTSNV